MAIRTREIGAGVSRELPCRGARVRRRHQTHRAAATQSMDDELVLWQHVDCTWTLEPSLLGSWNRRINHGTSSRHRLMRAGPGFERCEHASEAGRSNVFIGSQQRPWLYPPPSPRPLPIRRPKRLDTESRSPQLDAEPAASLSLRARPFIRMALSFQHSQTRRHPNA